jgi:linoleoyl-CoA desaturase
MDTFASASAPFHSDEARLESFGRALDAISREVERELGDEDAAHINRIGVVSRSAEGVGRALLHFSFEPVAFGLGVAALWLHKSLELMEIGHMALHGAYDRFPSASRYHAAVFRWKAPIDEASWRAAHNVRHHQYTNIEGRDPDLNFGVLRLSARVPHRRAHRWQPLSNLASWFGFATAINLHVTGMLDIYLEHAQLQQLRDKNPETVRAARRTFFSKLARYYGREYVFFPLLAGPFFWKVLLGNVLAEVGRDLYSAAVIYCGHVGAKDFPAGTRAKGRARWYAMQVEAARNIEVPHVVSILCGGLDRQIEHHLFPRLPPNRLREIAPRVRAVCEAHGVRYLSKGWLATLREVVGELRGLSKAAAPLDAIA